MSEVEDQDEVSRRINAALEAGPLREELDRRAAETGRAAFTTEEVLRALAEVEAPDEPETPEEAARLDQALIEEAGGEAMLRVRAHEIARGERGTPIDEVFAELDAEEGR